MTETSVDLETNSKATDSKDATAKSSTPFRQVLIFGIAAAALAILLIVSGVVFSHGDTPAQPSLSTRTNTTPARIGAITAPLGATVKTHTLPLPAQAVVFYKKHFVAILASAVVLVLVVVAVVMAAVFLKQTDNYLPNQEEPVVLVQDPEPETYVQPEEPMSFGALVGIAGGVLVAVVVVSVVGSSVMAKCRGVAGPSAGVVSNPNWIIRNPDEPLPAPQECMDRFQAVMRLVNDGIIKLGKKPTKDSIKFVDNKTVSIPDSMCDYNAADLTVALNDPNTAFFNYNTEQKALFYDSKVTKRYCYFTANTSIFCNRRMSEISFYENQNYRTAIFGVIKELESRIPAETLAI